MAPDDGFFLNINKPSGITSFDCIRRLRRITGIRKMGHLGTLDPPASGVLPVAAGRGTRLIRYLEDSSKIYRAVIRLGIVTDTDDLSGNEISAGDPSGITQQMVKEALKSFVGHIRQRPPAVSAVKVEGRRAYALAREGETVSLKTRDAFIYRIDLLSYENSEALVEMETARGVYVRSVARDLGEALGCGGAVGELVRTKSGGFKIENSVTLEKVEEAFSSGRPEDVIIEARSAMDGFETVRLNQDDARQMANGIAVSCEMNVSDKPVVVLDSLGRLLSVARIIDGLLKPETVLMNPDELISA